MGAVPGGQASGSRLRFFKSWFFLGGQDYFGSIGTVLYADVIRGPDNRSKGCGIVEFENPEDAMSAIQTLNDSEFDGRVIFVREDREDFEIKPPGGGGGAAAAQKGKRPKRNQTNSDNGGSTGRRVFVGNLSWDTAWFGLKDHFREAGEVLYADVMTETGTGRSKGCGIVEFATTEDAAAAISMLNESELDGRNILVREDREG